MFLTELQQQQLKWTEIIYVPVFFNFHLKMYWWKMDCKGSFWSEKHDILFNGYSCSDQMSSFCYDLMQYFKIFCDLLELKESTEDDNL